MKKFMLITMVAFVATMSHAQVKVGVNINIGSQPVWGPAGYDYVEYYYLPDIDAYYYVPRHQFIFLSNGRWIFASSLPVTYRHYDLYRGYKVVINEPRPYLRANVFRERYGHYKGRRDEQVAIRHDNGNHNGWYKHEDKHGHGKKD